MMTGIKVGGASSEHWKLDLGAGNVLVMGDNSDS